jgi:hypothetical protein
MDELLKLLGLGTPVLYATGTYGLFHWLDTSASDEANAAIFRLISLREYNKPKLSHAIVEIFDKVYSFPLLTWRALLRSAIITLSISALYMYESGVIMRLPTGWSNFLISFTLFFHSVLVIKHSQRLHLFVYHSALAINSL